MDAQLRVQRRARRMRREPTFAEGKLWELVRDRRLAGLKFRRQVPLGPYVADFACFEARLVVEADGGVHVLRDDGPRDAWFAGQGFNVLRISNEMIVQQPDRVEGMILEVCGKARRAAP